MIPEDVKKKINSIGAIAIVIVFVGAGLFLIGFLKIFSYTEMIDEKYLTDKNIPYSELKNATYTYTAKDILQKAYDYAIIGGIGGLLIFLGGLTVVALPSKKENHKHYCSYNDETKYCSHCGLKLSLLEKK